MEREASDGRHAKNGNQERDENEEVSKMWNFDRRSPAIQGRKCHGNELAAVLSLRKLVHDWGGR